MIYYSIIPYAEIYNIDQSLLGDNFRRSPDDHSVIVKWEDSIPEYLKALSGLKGPYTREEIAQIMNNEWKTPMGEF